MRSARLPLAFALLLRASAFESGSRPALEESLAAVAATLRPQILHKALDAYGCALKQGLISRADRLTIIDYSLPSTGPRLWVFDITARRLLLHELVAHGRNSGGDVTTSFSNSPGSFQSSLGLFVTAEAYTGGKGYALKLRGLEPGINDRALERAIVIHGAPYVSSEAAVQMGRLGRSLGCPAVSQRVARRLIDAIRDGSAVFAWYPDAQWLERSQFLAGCRTRE